MTERTCEMSTKPARRRAVLTFSGGLRLPFVPVKQIQEDEKMKSVYPTSYFQSKTIGDKSCITGSYIHSHSSIFSWRNILSSKVNGLFINIKLIESIINYLQKCVSRLPGCLLIQYSIL